MKVIRSGAEVATVCREKTVVGEVYTHRNGGGLVYLRTQGGFAVLNTGQFIHFPDAGATGWIHEPNAIVDLKPGDA